MKNWHKGGGIDALFLIPISKKVRVFVNKGHLAKLPTWKVDFPKDVQLVYYPGLHQLIWLLGELGNPFWEGAYFVFPLSGSTRPSATEHGLGSGDVNVRLQPHLSLWVNILMQWPFNTAVWKPCRGQTTHWFMYPNTRQRFRFIVGGNCSYGVC